jgi:Ca2+:H+ antiporter
MAGARRIAAWAVAAPVAGAAVLAGHWLGWEGTAFAWLAGASLIACVLAAVVHAECVAAIVGEPFGTMILALAITGIEAGLIITLMFSGGPAAGALARDTIFATIMLILNGMLGLGVLIGSLRHREQEFKLQGTSAALTTLAAISVLTLVLPNYTQTTPGPYYSPSQLAVVAVVSLVLYATFAFVQGSLHREHFLEKGEVLSRNPEIPRLWGSMLPVYAGLLIACLACVVLLAKSLSLHVEQGVAAIGAPAALVGIIIAAVVLMPEGFAALRAAHENRLQTSLNLALGSAIASIGLTIPAVALVSLATGWRLTLGIDTKSTVLLVLSLFVAALSLRTGRTTILEGIVHLVILVVYIFLTIVP